MDFGASTSVFEARLCHLIFIYLESNAVILHKFWRPQPTLPCFGLQYSISKKTRTERFHFLQCTGSSPSKQAWRKPKEGKVGCLHQDIFTRKVTDIAFTSNFCNNYSHPASPASMYLTSPRPRPTLPRPILPHVPYLMSSSPLSRVPKSQVLSPKSPHTRPDAPVPLSPSHFYTQPLVSHKRVGIALQATVETLYEK